MSKKQKTTVDVMGQLSDSVSLPTKELDLGLEKLTFHCACWSSDHHFHVTRDLVDDEVSVELRVNHYLPWYRRMWVALKYVFKMDKEMCGYSEVLLSRADRKKLAKVLLWEVPTDNVKITPAGKKRLQQLAGISPKEEGNKNDR